MKKKLSYRDKLLELAFIYSVKEIQDYVKSKKNLTSGQLELILKKNKITIPKDYKTTFIKENFTKPINKIKNNIYEFTDEQIKNKNKFLRKTENFKYDTQRQISGSIKNLWKNIGKVGLNFLNIIPTLGRTFYDFFANLLTELFNGIYNQQFNPKSTKAVIIGFFAIVGITTLIITSLNKFEKVDEVKKIEIDKKQTKQKKVEKKPEIKNKKVEKKSNYQAQKEKQPKLEVKRNSVSEVILPDLNLKTETVLNLFKDVDYDLSQVRNKKLVKPIYFTQFPKDLNELQNTRLKKETFIKIVLPLIVAENERILADRKKLKKIVKKTCLKT